MSVVKWRPGLCVLCAREVNEIGAIWCHRHDNLSDEAIVWYVRHPGTYGEARTGWTAEDRERALQEEAEDAVASGRDHL